MIAAVRAIIAAAAIQHGVSVAVLDEMARCESTYRPAVISSAGDIGLYQLRPSGKGQEFLASGYTDYFDPAQQANFFAEQLIKGEMWAWPACWRRTTWLIRTQ